MPEEFASTTSSQPNFSVEVLKYEHNKGHHDFHVRIVETIGVDGPGIETHHGHVEIIGVSSKALENAHEKDPTKFLVEVHKQRMIDEYLLDKELRIKGEQITGKML